MNAGYVFDVCSSAYRQAWAEVYEKCGMKALDAGAFKKTTWRPDKKPRVVDFLADFALAGRAALEREGGHSRLILFEMYCLGGAPWKRTCRIVGISELTGAEWLEEIKGIVGMELVARGIYPVRRYFLEQTAEYDPDDILSEEAMEVRVQAGNEQEMS